jgi:hypothetical protein
MTRRRKYQIALFRQWTGQPSTHPYRNRKFSMTVHIGEILLPRNKSRQTLAATMNSCDTYSELATLQSIHHSSSSHPPFADIRSKEIYIPALIRQESFAPILGDVLVPFVARKNYFTEQSSFIAEDTGPQDRFSTLRFTPGVSRAQLSH